MTNHVHFKNVDDESHSGEIVVSKESDELINVQLGILMTEHEYTISFKLPLSSGYSFTSTDKGELTIANVVLEHSDGGEASFKATVTTTDAHGQFKQNINFGNDKNKVIIVVDFSLMNDHLGTPFLRNGLHCVRRLTEA